MKNINKVEQFFKPQDLGNVSISPDGQYLAFNAPIEDAQHIFVVPISAVFSHQNDIGALIENPNLLQFRVPNSDQVTQFTWLPNNQDIVFLKDNNGDENWQLYCFTIGQDKSHCLTPVEGVQVKILKKSAKFPDDVVIAMNRRNIALFDVYRLNVKTNDLTLLYENQGVFEFLIDHDFKVRFGFQISAQGAGLYQLDHPDTPLMRRSNQADLMEIFISATTRYVFSENNDVLYLLDSCHSEYATLSGINLQTGQEGVLAELNLQDIHDFTFLSGTDELIAVSNTAEKPVQVVFDQDISNVIDIVNQRFNTDCLLGSIANDKQSYVLYHYQDSGVKDYYLYQKASDKVCYLGPNQLFEADIQLTPIQTHQIEIDLNLEMTSFFYDAKEGDEGPVLVWIHGGPNYRIFWDYNPVFQFFAHHGISILAINYRGSSGYGRDFTSMSNGQWGGKVIDDVSCALNWVKTRTQGKAPCFVIGRSFGGYATLMTMIRYPELLKGGIDIVGPTDLQTMYETLPAYWKAGDGLIKANLGCDPETDEGKAFLQSQSPMYFKDKITTPLQIFHGANDARVKVTESQQMYDALHGVHQDVELIIYDDEGHDLKKQANLQDMYGKVVQFLKNHAR